MNRLGVIGGENGGFPNGRRLSDDVVDAAEQVMAGFLKGNKVPLGGGVNADDRDLLPAFPYAADPQSGFDNTKGKGKNARWGRINRIRPQRHPPNRSRLCLE